MRHLTTYGLRKQSVPKTKTKIMGKEYDLTAYPPPSGKPIKTPLTIATDYDDTLAEFTGSLLTRIGKEFPELEDDPSCPLDINNVEWGFRQLPPEPRARAKELFNSPDFFENLPLRKNSEEFVKEMLRRGHDLTFCTATYTGCMSTRGEEILKNFPGVAPNNIIITGRKDLVDVDVLIDDGLHNIEPSIAKVPVLVDAPWNRGKRGFIRAFDGLDYIEIIDLIERGYTRQDILRILEPRALADRPLVVSIVGPSGSGKTEIVNRLTASDNFKRVITTTTRSPRSNEPQNAYIYKSVSEFMEGLDNGFFLEHSRYAGNYYGTSYDAIESIISNGAHALLVVDVNGAKAIKEAYPDNSISVFINRNEKDIVASILARDVPDEDKINRIVQLSKDFEAIKYCQYSIDNNGPIDETVESLKKLVL